ncbi:MAG TPA: hypothetical protein VFC78_08045 [Tepidisphaeraceae bacterium]|nr:hypothetical protein [Tepidisphaeraceae bacterium]
MIEPANDLEARLSRLKPRPLPGELTSRIAARIESQTPPHDRFLWGTIVSGAAAACTIIAMLVAQPAQAPSSAGATMTGARHPMLVDYRQALARADADWLDSLK